MKFQLVALNYYEQMITNNPFKCIDLPYSEILIHLCWKHLLIIIQMQLKSLVLAFIS